MTANAPTKAGPVELNLDPQDIGMISIVEHGGQYYVYLHCAGGFAVALSQDGLLWKSVTSPAFGEARKLPLPGVDSGGVFIDPKDEEYPFKGIFDIREAEPWSVDPAKVGDVKPVGMTQATARGGLYLFRSRDGLQWELVPGLPVPFLCDTQNQVIYDARLDRYVAYLRAFPTLSGLHRWKRCVARTEMRDLYNMPWPHESNSDNKPAGSHDYPYINDEMAIVMAADNEDPPGTDLYNPAVHPYPWAEDVYLAFPSLYRCYGYSGKNISHGRDLRGNWSNDGCVEIHPFVSRDGLQFTRYRKSYVPSGLIRDREGVDGELDCGLIMMAVGMIRRGDEIWQYYYGTRRTHGAPEAMEERGMQGRAVFRVVQRLDGFISLDAGHHGGEITTPPLQFSGNRLNLNADCGGLGEIRVALLDISGNPWPGYSIKEAVSIDRNGTAQEVWWQKGPDVSSLAGKPVRLHIKMRSAKLYAFRFIENTI